MSSGGKGNLRRKVYGQGIMVVFSPMQPANTECGSRQGFTKVKTNGIALNYVCEVVGYSGTSGPVGDQCHCLML